MAYTNESDRDDDIAIEESSVTAGQQMQALELFYAKNVKGRDGRWYEIPDEDHQGVGGEVRKVGEGLLGAFLGWLG